MAQKAPRDNLASKTASLEDATVVVFDIGEQRLYDPGGLLEGWVYWTGRVLYMRAETMPG